MRRPDDDDAHECLRAIAKRCEGRGGDLPGIHIARVRRNQCFGSDVRNGGDISEQLHNLPPQAIGLRSIKAARDGRPPGNHLCRTACILLGLYLMTMSTFKTGKPNAA